MTVKSEIRGAESVKEHLQEMKKLLKETGDPLLRSHFIQLRKEWGVRIKLPKVAA